MGNILKISQQTFWQLLAKLVTSISTLIILGVVARAYGESGTGIFTLTTTYLGLFYLFADFGFNAYVLKKVARENGNLGQEWAKLLGARVLWAGFLIILAVILLPLLPFTTAIFFYAVLLGSLDILASAVFTTNNLVFQSKLKYELVMVATFIGRVLGLAVFLYLAAVKVQIPFLIFSYLSGGMIISLISLFLAKRLVKSFRIIFDLSYIKNLFLKSWPIALTLVLNVIYFRADVFILATLKSASEVGTYNVAYSIFQSALVVPAFIMNSYYPMMLKSFKGFSLVGFGLLLIASVGTLVTFLLAPFMLKIITGGGFEGSAQTLQILSFGFPAYFLSALLMWTLVTKGKYKQMLIIYTSALFLNLILNFIYIPKYSFLAAAWTTVISEYAILGLQGVVLLTSKKKK